MTILKMMFRVTLVTAMALIAGFAANAQQTFIIKGQLASDKLGKIYLQYRAKGESKKDSTTVINGSFTFKGEITEPCLSKLELNPPTRLSSSNYSSYDSQSFFLDPGITTVTGKDNLKTAKIGGGKSQDDYTRIMTQYKPIQDKMSALSAQMTEYKKSMNDTAMRRVQQEYQPLSQQLGQIDSNFILTHTNSYTAFELWQRKHRGIIDPDLESEFKHFSPTVQNSEGGRVIAAKIAFSKNMDVGKIAPDFTLPDTLGKPVSLSSFKGKNVLVCFYTANFIQFGQLCFNLGRINRRLQEKNFVILGVYYNSINKGSDTYEFWKSTIAKNSMNWVNVADMHGLDVGGNPGDVAKKYGLERGTLEQAYLIGPDGKILARNVKLGDKELAQKLEKLIK